MREVASTAVLRTVNGGRTWFSSTLPNADGEGSDIACTTTKHCIVVGGNPSCIDDLARITRMRLAESERLRAGQTACRESGWLFGTTDGGNHWTRRFHRTLAASVVGGADLHSVACPGPIHCYAGGYGIWLRSTNGAQTRSVDPAVAFLPNPIKGAPTVTPPQRGDNLPSLSCTGPSTCWAMAYHLNDVSGLPIRTTDGGRSWQLNDRNVPPLLSNSARESGGLTALNSPVPDRCFAVGAEGLVMAYSPD